MMTWANFGGGGDNFQAYTPWKGSDGEADFKAFADSNKNLMASKDNVDYSNAPAAAMQNGSARIATPVDGNRVTDTKVVVRGKTEGVKYSDLDLNSAIVTTDRGQNVKLKYSCNGYFTGILDLNAAGINLDQSKLTLTPQVKTKYGKTLAAADGNGSVTVKLGAKPEQTVDNVDKIVLKDKVNWDGYHVESSPQLAFNIGLDYRGPRNWFAGVNFNYYDNIYLSMNPMYRTATAIKYYTNVLTSNTATNAQKASALSSIKTLRKQEKFDSAYTLSANIGKNWYIHRVYMLGFSLEVKNILNDLDSRTGGYEQMRMS